MPEEPDLRVNRLERRKQRTRAALVKAAQTLIAEGRLNVPVLEITQAADVGMGSFYNHFDSKEQLSEAAVADVLDTHWCSSWTTSPPTSRIPPRSFACSFRLSGSVSGERPQESRILLANWGWGCCRPTRVWPHGRCATSRLPSSRGASPSMTPNSRSPLTGGALLGVGHLLQTQPERDAGTTSDAATESVLRLFGMSADDAREVCALPLPDLEF